MMVNFVVLLLCHVILSANCSSVTSDNDRVESREITVTDLETQINLLTTTFGLTDKGIILERERINSLNIRKDSFEREILAEANKNQPLASRIAVLEQAHLTDSAAIQQLQAIVNVTKEKRAGFWAEVVENHSPLSVRQPIIWSNVALNIGNDYNPSTGMFRCRVGGMYWIGLSIFAKGGESMHAEVFKNGSPGAVVLVDTYSENNDQSAAWIIIELSPGDEIYAASTYTSDRIYSRGKYSFFSGFLIA